MDYLSALRAVRRENLNNISLWSEYNERTSAERNRLGSDFKRHLLNTFMDHWLVSTRITSLFTAAQLDGMDEEECDEEEVQSQAFKNRQAVQDKINFNVRSISIELVEDLEISGEIGRSRIDHKAKYVRTMQELDTTFMAFCSKMLGSAFEKVSIKTLGVALKEVMEDLFETFETDAVKIILYHANRPKFEDIIQRALLRYSRVLAERQRTFKSQRNCVLPVGNTGDRFYKKIHTVSRKVFKIMPLCLIFS